MKWKKMEGKKKKLMKMELNEIQCNKMKEKGTKIRVNRNRNEKISRLERFLAGLLILLQYCSKI